MIRLKEGSHESFKGLRKRDSRFQSIEALEQRIAPAIFTVTTTADSGPGSLRQAILDANALAGDDDILFNIAGSGVQKIQPATLLPPITEAVFINGYSQTGAAQNTQLVGSDANLLIEIDGSLLSGTAIYGLDLVTDGVEIRGLVVNRFEDSNIFVQGSNHIIAGNYIGTTADGLSAAGSSGNEGITLINATNVRIGGDTPMDRNVISGNGSYSIDELGTGSGTQILGNYIGTTKFGSALLTNGGEVYIGGSNAVIGGDTVSARNVIASAGAAVSGIVLAGSGALVKGNYIGLAADGVEKLGVGFVGVQIFGANATIGTATSGNVIVGAGSVGIGVQGTGATIRGNYIGTDSAQTSSMGNNGSGIQVGVDGAVIGGVATGERNIIAFNSGDGVQVIGSAVGVSIRGNSIHSNDGLGIDLVGGSELANGVTVNDNLDGDSGPNALLNYPVLGSVSGNMVTGVYSGAPLTSLVIDFYGSNQADPSGFGEGRFYLGSTMTTTDASGNASYTFSAENAIGGLLISATATTMTAQASTSEFSNLATSSAVFTWDGGGGADTSWLNPLNWDRDLGVPGAADTAILDTNATILIPSQVVVGNFFLEAGAITGPGELIVMQSLAWTSGTMSGSGITRVNGTMVMEQGPLNLNGRTLVISEGHTAMLAQDTELRVSNGARILNDGFLLFETGSRITDAGGSLSSFENKGNVGFDGLAEFVVPIPFVNTGAITLANRVTFTSDYAQGDSAIIVQTGEASASVVFQGRTSVAGSIFADVINDGGVMYVGGKLQEGRVNITGNFTQLPGSVLSLDLGKPSSESGFDRLTVTGHVMLNGSLEVNMLGDYIIPDGESFEVMTYQSLSGSFDSLRAPAGLSVAPGAIALDLNAQAPTNGSKVITVTDEDGDIVTVRVNKGIIPENAFTFGPNGELQILDLRAVGGKLNGAAVTISVEQVDGGNGLVDIGMINASGLNLSKVVVPGDLGQIDIGTGKGKKPALKSLVVNSLGGRGDSNQFTGDDDALLSEISGSVGSLTVTGNVKDAVFNVSGKLGKVTIGGDFLGGNGGGANLLAQMAENGRITPRVSGGSPVGAFNCGSIGTFTVKGSMNDSAVAAGNIGNVTVEGDLDKAAILAAGQIKNVRVFGAMVSNDAEEPAVIAAMARTGSTKPASAVAIDTLRIQGDVENARILLGYNKEQVGKNPDASAGKVLVEGNWIASSLVAGVIDSTGNGFGLDDAVVPGDTTNKIVSRIASIVIKGTATGSAEAGDSYAITAQQIGKLSINGTEIALDKNANDNVLLDAVNGDFRVVEVGP